MKDQLKLSSLYLFDRFTQNSQYFKSTLNVDVGGEEFEVVSFRGCWSKEGSLCSGVIFVGRKGKNEFELCGRGGPLFDSCNFNSVSKGIGKDSWRNSQKLLNVRNSQESTKLRQSNNLLKKEISRVSSNKSMIELIKVQQPHGDEIQVSFCQVMKCWVVSDLDRVQFCPFQENQEVDGSQNQHDLGCFWRKYLQTCADRSFLKEILERYTFCGKVNFEKEEIIWYSVVQTKKQSLCEDLFDAKMVVQRANFTFARIKTISVVDNEDQTVRALQKLINNVEGSFSESANKKYGRCKVYLVSNSNKQVLGGFDIFTLEDIVFDLMKELALGEVNAEDRFVYFEGIMLEFKRRNVRFPFPIAHFLQLFKDVLQLLSICGVEKEVASKNWFFILKLALYMKHKKIALQPFAPHLFKNTNMKNYLSELSMEQLGPINCKITTLYCYFNANQAQRESLSTQLNQSYKDLDIHFSTIKCSNSTEINIKEIIQFIQKEGSDHKYRHFLIDSMPRMFQLKCLIKELQNQDKEECFYRLKIIVQPEDNFVNVDGNIYPLSINSLAYAFFQAFDKKRKAALLSEKVQEMAKITEMAESIKNQELKIEDGLIVLASECEQPREEIATTIKSILKDKSNNKNYYVLMIQFEKKDIGSKKEMGQISKQIISKTYACIKSIPL